MLPHRMESSCETPFQATILAGSNLVASMLSLELWDEAKSLARDNLPAARQSLGADHDETLKINRRLAAALVDRPGRTRDHLRWNQHQSVAGQKTDLNTGDDLLEAQTIMQDVVQRRRRVFGPAHPDTRISENALFRTRLKVNSDILIAAQARARGTSARRRLAAEHAAAVVLQTSVRVHINSA